jgi:hypothetical protein
MMPNGFPDISFWIGNGNTKEHMEKRRRKIKEFAEN